MQRGAEKIAVLYRGKGITASTIYMKWRKRLNDHKKMALVTNAYQEEQHRRLQTIREEKNKSADYNDFKRRTITTTIRKYCRGLPGYTVSGQR